MRDTGMLPWLGHGLGLTGMDRPENRRIVAVGGALAVLAVLIRLLFWIYTQRTWDDALIAVLHSENAARGLGLTHLTGGDPVQGFTSPLGILLPLLGDLVRPGYGLVLLKLLSMPAAALTVLYTLALAIHPRVAFPVPLAVVAMAYVALEHHQILWGMSGMETQFAVLVTLAALYYTLTLDVPRLGVALGAAMLVRPDFAFLTVICGFAVFVQRPRAFWGVAGMALALYLPWVLFTTLYYGSPVPHTMVAKHLGFNPWWTNLDHIGLFDVKRQIWIALSEQLIIHLGPVFAGHGAGIAKILTHGPESPIANGVFGLAVVGGLVIAIRRQWSLWPLLLFAAVYGCYFVFLVPVLYGWYKMPITVVLLLLALRGLQEGGRLLPWPAVRTGVYVGVGIVYMGLFLALLPQSLYAERMIQHHIEKDVRTSAGHYLGEVMLPGEVVATEALGYIGYYSRVQVYDWPGLASPEVTDWCATQPREQRTLEHMIQALKPDYLCLRDLEVCFEFQSMDWLRRDYHVIKVFAVDPAVKTDIPWVEESVDLIFRIYRRKGTGEEIVYDDALFPPVPRRGFDGTTGNGA